MTLNIITKTVEDVAKAIRRQFGDESGVQLSDADVIRWVNEGQRDIAHQNKVLKAKATISSVALQADYTLPEADISSIESIHYDGVPILAVPYPEVEAYIKGLPEDVAGNATPQAWYEWAGVVTFYPSPATVGVITLLYTKVPPEVSSLGDLLSLPDKYFNTLLKYCMGQAHEMDEDFDAANYKTQQYGQDLDKMADDERTTQQLTYPVINMVADY